VAVQQDQVDQRLAVTMIIDGRAVATPLDSRMIVTPGPALERIPFVLSVAYGVAKSPAVCAAIRGRLVHGLVTHASLARAMLDLADLGDLGDRGP